MASLTRPSVRHFRKQMPDTPVWILSGSGPDRCTNFSTRDGHVTTAFTFPLEAGWNGYTRRGDSRSRYRQFAIHRHDFGAVVLTPKPEESTALEDSI